MEVNDNSNTTIPEVLVKEAESFGEWNDFAKNHKGFLTIAHNPSLKKILENSFGFETKNHLVKKGEEVVGIFPLSNIQGKSVSMPHFSYGDILTAQPENFKKDIREKLLHDNFDIRSFEAFAPHVDDSKIICYLPLCNSEEEQWEFWKSKLRSQIRKGMKNKVEIKFGGIEYLDDFYKVYSRNMRDLGSPVLGYDFFKNIFELYRFGEAKIFLAVKNNTVMAASVVLTYQNFAEVCWASSLREFNKLNPNLLMYWEMIKYCVQEKYEIFSFGRSSKDSNTLKFKRQWSPEEKQLYFNSAQPAKFDIKKYDFLSKIWSKFPLFFANYLGPVFSKNIY